MSALPSRSSRRRPRRTRGYALLIVMVGAIILAALSATLLRSATGGRADTRVHMRTVKALYAAEAAVSTGVESVRTMLDQSTEPDLSTVAPPPLPAVTWPRFDVSYVNPNDNYVTTSCTTDAECTGAINGTCSSGQCRFSFPVTLTEGNITGLDALQTPIQVIATADVSSATATVADIVRLNLIPIFQFAIFFDGDLIFQKPAPMTIKGPTHTNGGLHLVGSNSSPVVFESPITAAGYQQTCMLAASADCMGPSGDITVLGTAVTEGRSSHATDALHKASLETHHPDGIKDVTRGVEALSLPINVPATWNVEVTSRPDTCASNTYVAAQQNAAVALVKRPNTSTLSEYVSPYGTLATSGWSVPYGPVPTTDITNARLHTSASGLSDCNTGAASAAQAHCQALTRSVPRMTMTDAQDDTDVKSERMYWKAHVRIIDGIWYDRHGNVVFDPEAWALTAAANTSDATFQRGLKYARVTRYSWFWEPRSTRVYAAGNKYQRGEQIRTTDFDLYAFRRLLQDTDAVSEIFGASGVPDDGVIIYLSETWDPSHTDASSTDGTDGWAPRSTNVRNFLNFHTMENLSAPAAECFSSGQHTSPNRGNGLTPCALGWHPYYIWGDGAGALTGDADLISLTPAPTDPHQLQRSNPRDDTGYNCRVPVGNTGRSELPDYTSSPKAPCIEAGAAPAGAENAVRLVRATRMPERAGSPVGLTIATDNRLYVYGDVNATSFGVPQIQGRVALMADSITLLSQHFSDRIYQRGGNSSPGYEPKPVIFGFDGQPSSSLPHYDGGLHSGAAGAGESPNFCNAWREIGGIRPRRPNIDLAIYASLLMGDVPSCPGTGSSAHSGDTSGGVNNFPRFVEDWRGSTGQTVRIKGSIVNLFRAEQGNDRFLGTSWGETPASTAWNATRSSTAFNYTADETCVYTPPTRDWSFDEALEDTANLPPGTPRLVTVDRVRWMRR
jgi:hypothetical protein